MLKTVDVNMPNHAMDFVSYFLNMFADYFVLSVLRFFAVDFFLQTLYLEVRLYGPRKAGNFWVPMVLMKN